MDRYTYIDKYGRTVTRTSIDGDSRLSVSSYIYSKSSDRSLVFGRVQFFFKNDLDACTYAYIQWFNRPNKDSESELMFVFLDSVSSLNPIISVCDLCGPVVTAIDIDDTNVLWILSCISY